MTFWVHEFEELEQSLRFAGGQYHWISEFAPRSSQKVLSYFIGWLCTIGWQSGTAIGCFLAATHIQGLIVLNSETYIYERWHGTLLTIAMVLSVAIFNTFLAKHLPLVESFVLYLHLGGFVAILVPLWVLGPRGNSHDIWTQFEDLSDWGSSKLLMIAELPLLIYNSWSSYSGWSCYACHCAAWGGRRSPYG